MCLLLSVYLGLTECAYLAWRSEPISPAGYERVRLGMTAVEVETALGLPAGDYYTRHPRLGINSGPFVTVLSESGIPSDDLPDYGSGRTRDGRREVALRVWCGNTYCIWVAFDEGGVAVGRYLHQVKHPRDPLPAVLLDDFRVWLGW
jgi:hypothetical protein